MRRSLVVLVVLAVGVAAAVVVRRVRTDASFFRLTAFAKATASLAEARFARRRKAEATRRYVVAERLVDRVPTGPDPAPGTARYHWTARDIEQEWTLSAGAGAVMFKSPELALGADDIESIAVTLAPSREPVILLWNDDATFTRGDLLRNRRELLPSPIATTRVALRGEDIQAESRTPLRRLFINLPAGSDIRAAVQAIDVFTRTDRIRATRAGRIRFASSGHLRDAMYTRPGGAIELAADVPKGAWLSVDVRAMEFSASAAARITSTAQGHQTTLVEETVSGSAWHEVRVPLSSGVATHLRFEADPQSSATVIWGSPSILAADDGRRPNVILYVVDALRADRLGLYGAKLSPSPFLDGLGGGSLVFDRAYAAASWTKPSVTSLLTSLHPQTHALGARFYTDSLPDGVQTLQDALREHGYRTAQFSANPLSAALSNLDQGFDEAFGPDAFAERPAEKITAEMLNETVLPWLAAHRDDRVFVYVQSLDPHGPLAPVAGGVSARDPYDAAIESNDRQLRRVFQRLIDLRLDRDTLFIVTSDHGEAFGEHGRNGHGQSVYEEEVHVPLVLHLPGVLKPARVAQAVSLLDLFPTILDLCGIAFDRREIQGRSRAAGASGRGAADPVFSSTFVYPEDVDVRDPSRVQATALIEFPWKLILTAGAPGDEPRIELYDLSADPGERRSLASASRDRVETMRARVRQFLADQEDARRRLAARYGQPGAADPRRAVSRDVLEQLRSLGYVR